MSTLIQSPLAPLLQSLFREAANSPAPSDELAALRDDELDTLMRSKTAYLDFYKQLKRQYLAVSPQVGQLLYMLVRGSHARSIIEFGTSFGISTLHLAAALRDNGGGRLISSEFEPTKVARAQGNLAAAGLGDLVEIRLGDALQTLTRDLPETIDFVLLDGAKGLYLDILQALQSRLAPRAYIVADNVNYCPEYLAYVRNPANGYLSIPLEGEVELSMRLD